VTGPKRGRTSPRTVVISGWIKVTTAESSVSMVTLLKKRVVKGKDSLLDSRLAIVLESVVLMLNTKLSKSARAESRAWASSAVRDTVEPTRAGAMVATVELICVAMVSRWL